LEKIRAKVPKKQYEASFNVIVKVYLQQFKQF